MSCIVGQTMGMSDRSRIGDTEESASMFLVGNGNIVSRK